MHIRRTGDGMALVTVSDAAQRLGLSHSTVSRYLKRYSADIPSQRNGRTTVFDFELFQRHRADNVFAEGAAPSIAPETLAMPSRPSAQVIAASNDANVRLKTARAEHAELELARRKGELAPIEDFERVGTLLGEALKRDIFSSPHKLVDAIRSALTVPEAVALLTARDHEAVDVLSARIDQIIRDHLSDLVHAA